MVLGNAVIICLLFLTLVLLSLKFYMLEDIRYRQSILDEAIKTNQHSDVGELKSSIQKYNANMVVLDSFYPDWKALVDGRETAIHRTNYNFRGIVLPKGNHTVEFKYHPKSLEYGVIISGISLLVILFLLIKNNSHIKKEI